MKNIVIFILTVTLFSNCKKIKSEQPALNPETLLIEKNNYSFYEIVVAKYLNTRGNGAIIDGEINGKPAKIAVVNDSLITFAIFPDLYVSGSNRLSFKDSFSNHTIRFNVSGTATDADPVTVLEKLKTTYNEQLLTWEQLITADTGDVFAGSGTADRVKGAREDMSYIDREWAKLTPAEQTILANFFDANKGRLVEVNTSLTDLGAYIVAEQQGIIKPTSAIECSAASLAERYKCMAEEVWKDGNALLTYSAAAMAAIKTIPITRTSAATIASGLVSINTIPSCASFANDAWLFTKVNGYITCFSVAKESSCSSGAVSAPTKNFAKDKASALPISLTVENLSPTKEYANFPWLSSVDTICTRYNKFCDKSGGLLFKYKMSYAWQTKKETTLYNLDQIKVEIIQNKLVKVMSIGGTVQSPLIAFTTQETTTQTFSFKVTYNDGITEPMAVTLAGRMSVENISIGAIAQGGMVFYIDNTGEHGLVAALADQSSNSTWGCYGTLISGTDTIFGSGAKNTSLIVASCPDANTAARVCADLVLGGYSDWYLPSKEEVSYMYSNLYLRRAGNISNREYWTSTQDFGVAPGVDPSSTHALTYLFENAKAYSKPKDHKASVRAIRKF